MQAAPGSGQETPAVSGLRAIAAAEGYTIKASDLGKTKMFAQVVAISCMLLSVRHPALLRPSMILMWGVIVFAVLSAVSYFRKFWHKVDARVKRETECSPCYTLHLEA